MAQSPDHNLASPEAMELGYEPERIRARGLLLFIAIFLVAMVALQAVLWWIMKEIEHHKLRTDVPLSVLSLDQQPPTPNLQPSVGHDALDYQDMNALRSEEEAMFSKLGWDVNPATHHIGIPSDIVRLVAEQQRVRAAGAAVPPTTTGKDSNSIVPGPVPAYDTRPGVNGGQRP